VESLLDEAQVSMLETRVPVRKGNNFSSDRWIALKILQEFPEAVFLGVNVESLLGVLEVSSLKTRISFRKAITVDPTVGSISNFYRSFRMPFSV